MKSNKRHLISLCMVLIYVGIVYFLSGIYFQTNDDRVFAEIMSGSLTGKPDAHTVYLNYILSFAIVLLYQLTTSVPWYGIFLLTTLILALYLVIDSILAKAHNKMSLYICIFISIVFLLTNYFSVSAVQYTSNAILLAIAGYVYLILNKANIIVFLLIELLAYMLRGNGMLMVQPMGAAVFLCFILLDGGILSGLKNKKHIFVRWIIALISVFILGYAGNYIGYADKEWQEFQKYNDSRTTLFDFYGLPNYEDVIPILEKHEVTELEYKSFCNYVMLGTDISTECLEDLAQFMKEKHTKVFHFSDVLDNFFYGQYSKLNIYVYLVWAMVILYSVAFRKYKNLLPLAGILCSRLIIWSYLIYNGRIPDRITYPLLCAEMFMLFTVMVYSFNDIKDTSLIKFVCYTSCTCALFGAFLTGYLQYKRIDAINSAQKVYAECLVEVKQYCERNPSNRYVLDNSSFTSGNGHVFETRLYDKSNYVYTGGWFSYSPILNDRLDAYLDWSGNNGKIHFIVFDMPDEHAVYGSYMYARLYIADRTGKEPKLVDRLTLATGGEYLVYEY